MCRKIPMPSPFGQARDNLALTEGEWSIVAVLLGFARHRIMKGIFDWLVL